MTKEIISFNLSNKKNKTIGMPGAPPVAGTRLLNKKQLNANQHRDAK